MINISKW